jgi:hypothetical protein
MSGGPKPATLRAIPLTERLSVSGLGIGVSVGCAIWCFIIPLLWPIGILLLLCVPFFLLWPLFGKKVQLRGECPYCGHINVVTTVKPGFNCAACKGRIVVRDQQFIPV